jgi:hypothetical protein
MQSNFIGTDFHIYNSGEKDNRRGARSQGLPASGLSLLATAADGQPGSMTRSSDSSSTAACGRSELAVVQYHMNVLGTKGPRKMTIGIPYVDFDTNETAVWRNESMLGRCATCAKPSLHHCMAPGLAL